MHKLINLLDDQRAMRRLSLVLLIILVMFVSTMGYREQQHRLARYCEQVRLGETSAWRRQLGYRCDEVQP